MGLDLSALDDFSVSGPQPGGRGLAARAAVSCIEEDPDNPRFEDMPEDFAALVEDVRAHGILQPIVVRRLDSGKLRIRFGARRYRAAVQLGLPDVPYVVTEDPRQFDDYAQIAENERRTALQPLELATFIAKRLKQGDSKALVARHLGIHPSSVTHLLCLVAEVSPLLLELYHSRRCRTVQYLYRLGKLWKVDARRVEEGCAGTREIDSQLIEALESAFKDDDRVDQVVEGTATVKNANAKKDDLGMLETATTAKAQQLGSRGPAEAPTSAQAKRPSGRFRRPQLFGTLDGKEVEIDLVNRPSAAGKAIVRFTDELIGSEVDLRSLILTRLVEFP